MADTKKNNTDKVLNRFQDENGNYQKQDINWKKILIALATIASVVTIVVLIWGYAFGGFSWNKMRKEGSLLYETIYVEHDIDSYESKTKAEWSSVAQNQLYETVERLEEEHYFYSKKSYVVEISKKNSSNDCWVAITDKTIPGENPEGLPSKTIFVHEQIIDGQLNITELLDVYA